MQNDILFDNIYIGHSEEDAKALQAETFDIKIAVEKAEEEASKPKQAEKKTTDPKSPMDLNFMDDPVVYVREKLQLFITLVKRDPVEAVRFMPEVAATLGVGVIAILLLLGGIVGGAAPSKEQVEKGKQQANVKAQEASKKAQEVKDQVADAVASGSDKAKEEVNKRTTRSGQ